jgi:hypothetical protein
LALADEAAFLTQLWQFVVQAATAGDTHTVRAIIAGEIAL